MPACVRHPDRPTGLRCTRCHRPACPECLRDASVGQHCVDCVAEAKRTTREPVTVAGARVSTTPVVVPALIGLNVLVYVVTAALAGNLMQNTGSGFFQSWTLVPMYTADGDWWRILTSGFLHIGAVHLLMNMLALWVLGRDLEVVFGWLRFIAVYLLSLLGGSAAVFLMGDMAQPVAGASGAVYGLMGAIAVAAVRLKLNLRPILVVIAVNVIISVTIPGISLLGHLGGIVVGALTSAALLYAPAKRRTTWQLTALLGVFVLIAALFVTRDLQLADLVCRMTANGRACGVLG
ncbi:rhomboid family intramembrane serine protease [Allosaccharopolyspora coralli]|uniref:Rhomboid family intramembrane serine protease n=2 Tax=Allosaccharopolyspora coralli TaxID=2665642 RepID=A0A5Q3QM76_9PSEU|nr:rhomboid family intramembrane serine protease [Allosaccharopolyspora coralli]